MPDMDPITMYRGDETVQVNSQADKFARQAEGWSETPPKDQYPQLLWRGDFSNLEEVTVHSASEKDEKMGEGYSEERPADPNVQPKPKAFETHDQSPRGMNDGAAPGEAYEQAQDRPDAPSPDGLTPAKPDSRRKK
jgi:hypothetical protein